MSKYKILLFPPRTNDSFLLLRQFFVWASWLFGGKLADASTTIETKNGDVIAQLYHDNRTPITIVNVLEHVKNVVLNLDKTSWMRKK